jgi:hypothetical protein
MKITKWERLILYPLAVGLLILFAFYDLPIMKRVFNPRNVFGRMGELGGEIPTQLLGVTCGFWLFRFRDTSSKSRSLWWGILFFVIAIFFAGYGGGRSIRISKQALEHLCFHPGIWFAVPIAIVYLGVGALIAFKTKISNPKEAIVFAWFMILILFQHPAFDERPQVLLGPAALALPREPRMAPRPPSISTLVCLGLRWQLDDFRLVPFRPHNERFCWIVFAGASAFINVQRQGMDHPSPCLRLGDSRRDVPHDHGCPFSERHDRGIPRRAFAL